MRMAARDPARAPKARGRGVNWCNWGAGASASVWPIGIAFPVTRAVAVGWAFATGMVGIAGCIDTPLRILQESIPTPMQLQLEFFYQASPAQPQNLSIQ